MRVPGCYQSRLQPLATMPLIVMELLRWSRCSTYNLRKLENLCVT